MRVLVPTGIYRYVTGCDFLPIKQPKEVKLLSFNLAEQMPFMSNVRRRYITTTQRLSRALRRFVLSEGRGASCRRTVADGQINE